MKKGILCTVLILSALLLTTVAFADLVALSFTDTNNVQQTVAPPLGAINPSGAMTLYLTGGGPSHWSYQDGYVLKNSSGQVVTQGVSSSFFYPGDQFTVLGQTYYGKVMTISPSWGDGSYTLTAQLYNSWTGLQSSVDYPFTVDLTPPQITVYNGASQLANHGTVTGLDQIKIFLADNTDPSPQLTGVHLAGGPQNISVDLSYSAQTGGYLLQFPSISPSGGEYSLAVTARDAKGNVGTQTLAFSYSPAAPSFDSWRAYRSDTGWTAFTSGALGTWQFNTAVAVTQIQVAVQARPYDQVFVDPSSGSCTIPAGQTGCTLSTNLSASPGTMNWHQANCYVKDASGSLFSSTKYINVEWDLISPTITSHTTDQNSKVVTFQVTEPQTGSFGGASGLASGWVVAHNTGTGQDVQLAGSVTHLSGDNYQITVSYSSLPIDNWQLTLWARDNFGNTASQAAETLIGSYTITASAGANGSISPSGAVAVNYGASQGFTITPAAHYHVTDVKVDGASVGAVTSYNFANVTGAHTISATFAIDTNTITASAGANGSISPSGGVVVNYGASQGFTITAAAQYHVADVKVDGASVGAVTNYNFTNVTGSHTISASFAIDTFTISTSPGAHGTISPSSATVNYGGSQSFSITPATGYSITDVLVDGSSVGAPASYSFTSVTSNHTISASFADTTPPSITINNGASVLSNHGTVTDLTQIKIFLADNLDSSPQLTGVVLTGGPQSVSDNLTWSAQGGGYVPSFPAVNPSGGEYTLTVTAKDASGNVGTQAVAFSYSPPAPSFDSWRAYRSDTGWTGSTSGTLGTWQFNSAVAITQIQVAVTARPYDQAFIDPSSGSSCTIPAGQSGCTLSTNIVASGGQMKRYQSDCYVKDANGVLTSSTKHLDFQWDLVPPTINSYSIDRSSAVVTFQVTEPQTGSFGGASGLASGWVMAHNTVTGQDVQVNGSVSHLSGDSYQVSANYASLSEGFWQFTLWAKDNFANTASLDAETVIADHSPPRITIYNGSSPLANHGTVTNMDQINISVNDTYDASPQLTGVHLSGGPQNISADLSYKLQNGRYVLDHYATQPSGGQEYSLTVVTKDSSGNVGTQTVSFSYTPAMPVFASWQAYRSDTGWNDLTSGGLGPWKFNTAVTISQIRVLVEPRTYDQVFVDPAGGGCTIPAGQSECTSTSNITASPGTMNWYQADCYVTDKDGLLISATKHADFEWDLIPPVINSYAIDRPNTTVTFQVTEPQTGSFGGASGLASGWVVAHNMATGQDVQLPGSVTHLSGDNYQVTVNYASLAEANWQFTLWAKDSFDNTGTLPAEMVVVDHSSPQITIFNGTSQLANHGTVMSLKKLKIVLSDNLDLNPQLSGVHLSGGSQQVSLDLAYHAQNGAYFLDSPPVFSSGGQEYSLTVTSQDTSGNIATLTLAFSYAPAQIKITSAGQDTLNLPAISANVVHSNGTNALYSSTFTTDGQTLQTGTYDLAMMSASTSSTSVTINGVSLAPGEQKTIAGYDFGANGSRLNLPIAADNPGNADLTIASNAPNAPEIKANVLAWRPGIQLKASPDWAVQPIIQKQLISMVKDSSTPCSLSIDPKAAQKADPIDYPVCLVQWNGLPANYVLNDTSAAGVLPPDGSYTPGYQISVVNGGQQYQVASGAGQGLARLPVQDLSFKAASDSGATSFYRKVQQAAVNLLSNGPYRCPSITTSQTDAQTTGAQQVTCLVHWQTIPDGLQDTSLSARTPQVSGSFNQAGDQPVSWTVDLYSPYGTLENAASGASTLSVLNPPLPDFTFDPGYYAEKISDSLFVTSDLQNGEVGSVILNSNMANQANMTLELDGTSQGLVSIQYNPINYLSINRTVDVGPMNVWDSRKIKMRLYYTDMPDVRTEKEVTVYGVPSKKIKAVLSGPIQSLDTAGMQLEVAVGTVTKNQVQYNAATDGDWKARIGYVDAHNQFNPLTDSQALANGTLETALNGFTPGNQKLVAKVDLAPPAGIDFYSRTLTSNPLYAVVLKGTAPDGQVYSRTLSGPAPLSTLFSLQIDSDTRRILGSVVWQLSSDNGSSWQDLSIKTSYSAIIKVDAGTYIVRAKMTNRVSGAVGYSEGVQLIAYQVPDLTISGPRAAIVGTPISLTANLTYGDQVVAPEAAVVDWYNAAGEKVFTGMKLDTTPTQIGSLIYRVQARIMSAPESESSSWVKETAYVKVVPPKGPNISISMPSYMEYNVAVPQTYQLIAKLVLPFALDSQMYHISGEWHLPDGQVVEGTSASYSPTAQDADAKQAPIEFVAWIDGFKDQTQTIFRRSAMVGKYSWPDFRVDIGYPLDVAPASVILTATPTKGSSRNLIKPTYNWLLPASAKMIRQQDGGRAVTVLFPEAGSFDVSVTIADARGSSAEATGNVSLGEPAPFQVEFTPLFSNTIHRELLNVTLGVHATGGHPQDRLVDYEYSINTPGIQVDSCSNYGFFKNLRAGDYVAHLKALSLQGKLVEADFPFTVIANTPPTCQVSSWNAGDYQWWSAACQDPDGRIAGYRWLLDDKLICSGQLLRIKKGDLSGTLRFQAVDDAGGTYDEVLSSSGGGP